MKTWAAYFPSERFVPVERTAQIFEDLVHHRLSEATILKAGQELSQGVEPAVAAVKAQLREAEVLHADESGMRVNGQLHWLHVAATERLTHYDIHAKRGQEAMDEAGILPAFGGQPSMIIGNYFRYKGCAHGLCNAHHLRELHYIEQQYGQAWAAEMTELLLDIKQTVDTTSAHGPHLPPDVLAAFEQRYDRVVTTGYEANPRTDRLQTGTRRKKEAA